MFKNFIKLIKVGGWDISNFFPNNGVPSSVRGEWVDLTWENVPILPILFGGIPKWKMLV